MFQRFFSAGLMLLLMGQVTICSAESSLAVTPVAEPEYGTIRPLADGSGVVYVGVGNQPDSFSFAVADEVGTSWIAVEVDPLLDQSHISCLTWDGPVVTGVGSYLLCGGIKDDDDSAPTPPPNPPATSGPTIPEDPPNPDGYIVIIHVDQPGAGGDRDAWEGPFYNPDVGHAYIEIINGDTGESVSVGLYPNRLVTPLNPSAPGSIQDDSSSDSDVVHVIPITEEQYEDLVDTIARDRRNPPVYDLNDNNCTDYVMELLDTIGIEINSRTGTWPGGGGHNPGDFGEDLIDMGGIGPVN